MTPPSPAPTPFSTGQIPGDGHFAALIEPAELHFNAAHFITFAGTCENLHGHNFHVRLQVHGRNTADAFVVDFVELAQLTRRICSTLHDRVLLPGVSREVHLTRGDGWIEAKAYDKRFVFPTENCAVLPVSNTTAEMLAWHIGTETVAALRARQRADTLAEIEVAVEEADRQWGVYRRALRDGA